MDGLLLDCLDLQGIQFLVEHLWVLRVAEGRTPFSGSHSDKYTSLYVSGWSAFVLHMHPLLYTQYVRSTLTTLPHTPSTPI